MTARDGMARLEATVRGRVQGVGFRYFVVREATSLGLTGWVANEADGSVRCVAEGRRDRLEELAGRLRDGPRSAIVEDVGLAWTGFRADFDRFGVRSAAHRGD